MKPIIDQMHELFTSATLRAFPVLSREEVPIEVTQSTQGKFGHYQFNSAMRLAKPLKKSPRQIAEAIVAEVGTSDPRIASLEIAGPGFVNITLQASFLNESINSMVGDSRLGVELPTQRQRIIVEFSSPNTAKELHVGHLRSTIIGDSLARLFEFLGHDVLRLNHVGDWGTAFGMLIAYLKLEKPQVLSGKEETDLIHLVEWYKASKQRFDEDEEFKTQSREEVVKLQSGNAESLQAWRTICDISRKAYQEIYDLLNVEIEERGESFYNPLLPELIEDLTHRDLITVSDGAKCIFLEGFLNREGDPLPLMVQKSDGGFNYDTTDMAAMRYRCDVDKADRIIIITDAGQSTHFAMIYQASVKAGYLSPSETRFDHVPFGLVLGPDGKKFRTRAGDTEKLADLLTQAVERADNILQERNPDVPAEQRHSIAKSLGIGAVKYADLSCSRTGDYTFSYDRMLRFDGNTAAFLMYAYVRIAGIKRKIGTRPDDLIGSETIDLQHPSELALGLHLLRFSEALETMAEDLMPHRLCDYLYNLAERFNAFFRDCRVEGSDEQNSRLLLCELTAKTLSCGLHLLGIQTVERM